MGFKQCFYYHRLTATTVYSVLCSYGRIDRCAMSVGAVILGSFIIQCYSYFCDALAIFFRFFYIIRANFTPSVRNWHDLYVMEAY